MMARHRFCADVGGNPAYMTNMKILTTLIFVLFSSVSTFAASSEWVPVDGGKMRLIGMKSLDGGPYRAGLQIKLEPGWKTYWRNPGGSGLPPQLHFGASKNVENAEVQYPAPTYYPKDQSIGYKSNVTFPIRVTPVAKGLPMTLDVSGIVGICSDICIPTPVQLTLRAGDSQGTQMDVALELNRWEGKLPSAAHQGFSVESATVLSQDEKTIRVQARLPKAAKNVSLFVEGPLEWYLTHGTLVERQDTIATFDIPVPDAKTPQDLINARLRFTLVTPSGAVEQTMAIEPPAQ